MASSVASSELSVSECKASIGGTCEALLSNSFSKLISPRDGDRKTSRRTSRITDVSGPASAVRRHSSFKCFAQSIPGLLNLRRLTVAKINVEPIQYENTYKTDPDSDKIFSPANVNSVAMEIIEKEVKNMQYQPETCSTIACDLASKIKVAVKGLKCSRYRIICQVIVGEVKDQGIEAASRCLWDEKRDNYTIVSYRNASMFVNATVHGIYFE